MRNKAPILALAALLAACGGNGVQAPEPRPDSLTAADTAVAVGEPSDSVGTTVRTMGKVVAARYADLSFATSLPVESVLVRNGQRVRRGQALARLDLFHLRNAVDQQERAVEQARLQMDQAQLQMQDVIISQGYDPDKPAQVPDHVRHNADVKSGHALAQSLLATAQARLEEARHELGQATLTAPFDGVVANVAVQAHQLAQAGQPVCRVIASGDMYVEFRVMEADLARYKGGAAVTVVPVADNSRRYEATVADINPVVDPQGAVTIRARLASATALFDGMNVEVVLNNNGQ